MSLSSAPGKLLCGLLLLCQRNLALAQTYVSPLSAGENQYLARRRSMQTGKQVCAHVCAEEHLKWKAGARQPVSAPG
jgi:hypothetical protein